MLQGIHSNVKVFCCVCECKQSWHLLYGSGGLHETDDSEQGSYILYTTSYCSELILKPPVVLTLSLTQNYHLRCFRFQLWVAELL